MKKKYSQKYLDYTKSKNEKMKLCKICGKTKTVEIDNLVLCYNHAGEYLHVKQYTSSSLHRKTFEKKGIKF